VPSERYSDSEGRRQLRSLAIVQHTVALLTAGVLVCACSDYEPASDTLPSGSVSELNPSQWACLSSTDEPAAVPVYAQTVARVIYSIQVVDLSTGQIYPDAQVRACGVADVNCENPVTETLPVDSQGWVDLPLFRDFAGFLEITSSKAVPYLFYLTEPLTQSISEFPLAIISLASLPALVQLIGVDIQPGTGVIAVRSFGCDGNPAPGVQMSTSNAGVPWYFVDGLPTGAGSHTAGDGLSGLVNVPPGLALFDLKAPNGASIRGQQSVVIRPNWLSAAYVRPPMGRRQQPD
jgi:hypothetical protein